MAKTQFVLFLFPAFLMDLGLGEIVTLSELWSDSPCNKEITLSKATNDIQLRAQSVHITQVKCKDENNAPLDLTTRVIHADTFYKITNPEVGTWNCSFRSQLHARVSYCVINIKDHSKYKALSLFCIKEKKLTKCDLASRTEVSVQSDASSGKEFKVHEILSWFSLLAAVSTAVMIALIIIVYYKRKVKRIETNAIYDHVRDRAPLELPSEIIYDSVYSHRMCLNLKRHSTDEEQKYCNSKPKQDTVNLDENTFKAGYIPHNTLFV